MCLEVGDTGSGMTPDVMSRIFDPFFTTKAAGEGTGLGLAMVRSIMLLHEGTVNVSSVLWRGTTFALYFPVLATATASGPSAKREISRGHGQHLLLVDDELMVVKPLQMMLQRIGYEVTISTHPEEALSLFKADASKYDAIISDLQMPVMTGVELAKKILAIRPGVPVFIASGYTGDPAEIGLTCTGIRGMIAKPTDLAELAEVLARTFAE
jgi:CheY-like chemotaxis protein